MDIRTEVVSLGGIVNAESLGKGETRFYIPPIQRQYQWGPGCENNEDKNESARVFLEDCINFFDASRTIDDPYFLGTMIVYQDENDPAGRLHLMDGQQRWTTITALMSCIFHLLDGSARGDHGETKSEISESFLSYIEDGQGKPRLVSDRDFDSYTIERLTEFKGNVPLDTLDPSDSSSGLKNTPRESFLTTYGRKNGTNLFCVSSYFLDRLCDRFSIKGPMDSRTELSKFYNFIKKRIFLNLTLTPDASVAYRMFITANTRGTDLTNFDIFRGLVLARELELKLNQSQHYRQVLQTAENTLQRIISDSGKNVDQLKKTNQIMAQAAGILLGKRVQSHSVMAVIEQQIVKLDSHAKLSELCGFISEYFLFYHKLMSSRLLPGDYSHLRMRFAGFEQHVPIYIAALMRWRDLSKASRPLFKQEIRHLMMILECFFFRVSLSEGKIRPTSLAFYDFGFKIAREVRFSKKLSNPPTKDQMHHILEKVSSTLSKRKENPDDMKDSVKHEYKVQLGSFGNHFLLSTLYALEDAPFVPIKQGSGRNDTFKLVSLMPSIDSNWELTKTYNYGQEKTGNYPGSKTIGNQFLVYEGWDKVKKWDYGDHEERIRQVRGKAGGVDTTLEDLDGKSDWTYVDIKIRNISMVAKLEERFPKSMWLPDRRF